MNAQEIINYIATAPKKTPVKIYVNLREPVDFASCGAKVFGEGLSLVVFGNWADLEPVVPANAAAIAATDSAISVAAQRTVFFVSRFFIAFSAV